MSSIPGFELDDYVMWKHDLIVDFNDGANESLRIVELLFQRSRRIRITRQQFLPILALYEPYREQVERILNEFDEDIQSWRDYAGHAFDTVTDAVSDEAQILRAALTVSAGD